MNCKQWIWTNRKGDKHESTLCVSGGNTWRKDWRIGNLVVTLGYRAYDITWDFSFTGVELFWKGQPLFLKRYFRRIHA